MTFKANIDVIIPALNEEKAIQKVIHDIPDYVRNILVVDNNSSDNTALMARKSGAIVLLERERGYGSACLHGINFLKELPEAPDILVFMDGDYADYGEDMDKLLQPILHGNAEIVIGSRVIKAEKNSLTSAQKAGNWIATLLLRKLYKVHYTDLGPFRAIKWDSLLPLGMCDRNYGWTVEMQIKAAQKGLKYAEVPVRYRNRIGQSKVSGTIKGSLLAGYKIILTIIRYL